MTTTTARTDDGLTLHIDAGPESDKPVLVLVHSLAADHTMWDPQVEAFGERFRVVRFDLRGHGRSDLPPGPATIERYGKDVLAVLDSLDAQSASYCGLSIGGGIGLWLSANAAPRFRGVVAASTLDKFGTPEMWEGRMKEVREGGLGSQVDGTMARWFTAPFRDSHPDTIEHIRKMFLATRPEGYLAAAAALRDGDLTTLRPGAPTMLIAGDQDPGVPAERVRALAERLGIQAAIIPGAAHQVSIEQPAAFNQAVLGFLK